MLGEKNKYILIVLIYLSAQNFFNPLGMVSPQVGKALFYIFSLVGLYFAFKSKVKLNRIKYPRQTYKLLIIGICISIAMGSLFHEQSFMVSMIATLPYLFAYLFFFILMKLQVDKALIEKTLMILVVCSLGMYLANLAVFPNKIFGVSQEEYDMSRGFARLGVPMIEIVVLFLFYSINKWLVTGRRKWLCWIGITAVLIVMSLTRQIILISFVFGLWFVQKRARMGLKVGVVLLSITLYYMVLPKIPMFKTMMELSKEQAEENKYNKEDIRITAWKFYTTGYQSNTITPYLGNGIPSIGNSVWGNKFEKTVSYVYSGNGCFYVDVGWAGFFWLFGGLATYSLLSLLLLSYKKRKDIEQEYINYWLLFIIISSITSAPIIFANQIVGLCLVFYLIYGNKKIYSRNNTQLQ